MLKFLQCIRVRRLLNSTRPLSDEEIVEIFLFYGILRQIELEGFSGALVPDLWQVSQHQEEVLRVFEKRMPVLLKYHISGIVTTAEDISLGLLLGRRMKTRVEALRLTDDGQYEISEGFSELIDHKSVILVLSSPSRETNKFVAKVSKLVYWSGATLTDVVFLFDNGVLPRDYSCHFATVTYHSLLRMPCVCETSDVEVSA
ncbi:MAG: hypothetical protein NTW50_05595 [Candidatus Berkelbacteria bacterium]|nr:hypothetical protein [Candidatus Berkelbacteria bacterium]